MLRYKHLDIKVFVELTFDSSRVVFKDWISWRNEPLSLSQPISLALNGQKRHPFIYFQRSLNRQFRSSYWLIYHVYRRRKSLTRISDKSISSKPFFDIFRSDIVKTIIIEFGALDFRFSTAPTFFEKTPITASYMIFWTKFVEFCASNQQIMVKKSYIWLWLNFELPK